MRADVIDDEVAALLQESGCYEVLLGIESGNPQVLQNMNKRLDPEKSLRSIEALDSVGIRTLCSFVVGFPRECAKSIEQTSSFISSLPFGEKARTFHRYYLFRFVVSPLSPVASPEQRALFGLKGIGEKWEHKTMSAYEAQDAVREIFLKVDGPSHFYMEELPLDWNSAAIRQVIELRDTVQKNRLRGRDNDGVVRILSAVKKAEFDIRLQKT
jgi:p-methyltransferase